MELEGAKKLTFFVNTVLLIFVIVLGGVYVHFQFTDLVYGSIIGTVLYIACYYIIHKGWLHPYVWIVYIAIALYMLSATLCLGTGCGFHLYCFSLIPLIFYIKYMAHQLKTRAANPLLVSLSLVVVFLLCTGYVTFYGPRYEVNETLAYIFMAVNAVAVFGFLIGYTAILLQLAINSEEKLSDMAHTDKLTGLPNRHYMLEQLEALLPKVTGEHWMAMVDIDNFKQINDTYGHNCGDDVLVRLSQIIQQVCKDCVVSRWGGEEFLITADGRRLDRGIPEQLRKAVEADRFVFQGTELQVTITVGVSNYQAEQSLDTWIQSADNKLYEGKNNGKNQVVY